MNSILRPLKWFYHEFGVDAVHNTGRNAYFLILARTCRMFAFGTNSLVLAIFFSALDFSDTRIGIFMTLTLAGDLVLGTFLTLIADRVGRRKVLIGGSIMMIVSGTIFALFENYWLLLFAAIVGVVSVTGGDFGPFRSIEESVIAGLTTSSTRADVLAWYVTISTLGSSLGSEASGRAVRYLEQKDDWSTIDAYHALFWIYTAMGIVNLALTLLLSDACELSSAEKYQEISQDTDFPVASQTSTTEKANWSTRTKIWLSGNLSQISASTRSVMYKLWFLLAVDSLADGMVPYSLTNYFMDVKFHPSKSTLGDVTSISYFLGAIGSSFAGPLARRIGLINTMVFTHIPSSAAVLLFPFPPVFWLTAAMLLLRTALNPMDQAPRSAFIAAVVKPQERTSVMGITAMLRTLASMAGPTVTGFLAAKQQFWIAFVAAGIFRLAYDFGLYAMFVNMKVDDDTDKSVDASGRYSRAPQDDEEFELESPKFSIDDSSSDDFDMSSGKQVGASSTNLQPSDGTERVRSRSPHSGREI